MSIELMNKYATQAATTVDSMNLGEEIMHGAVASVVDAGASIWNSLTPASMEASTEDLLSRIDSSALQVYNEHPDAVKAASFIGGSFIPAGIALKGMKLMRAGSKGVGLFSEAGRISRLKEVETAFANGGAGVNEAISAAKLRYYGANAINQVADMAAIELAIVGTMSAHPYMEDYNKDFGKNFLINMAIGGTLGAGIGHVIARKEISATLMGVQKELTTELKAIVKTPEVSENLATHILRRQQNADALLARVQTAEEGKISLSNYTKESMKVIAQSEQAKINTIADSVFVGALKEASHEERALILDHISRDIRFGGAEQIGWASSIKGLDKVGKVETVTFAETPTLFQKVINKVSGLEEIKKTDAVYLPWANEGAGAFVPKKDARDVLTLADAGVKDVEALTKLADKRVGFVVRNDAAFEASVLTTAEIEKDIASSALHLLATPFDKLTKMELGVAPGDMAAIHALNNRVNEAIRAGDDISKLKIAITNKSPSYEVRRQQVIRNAGFSPSYLNSIAYLNTERSKFQLMQGLQKNTSLVSEGTTNELLSWVRGRTDSLREAAKAFNRGESLKTDAYKALVEIYTHPNSVAFRDSMRQLADTDGNVLLYRGLKSDPKGHHALESYTLNPGKAKAFSRANPTGLRLYKVHVDDIVGTVEDYATTLDKANSNMEIMVARVEGRTRPNAVVSTTKESSAASRFFNSEGALTDTAMPEIKEVTAHINPFELNKITADLVTAQVKDLNKLGMGIETISLRSGVPESTVRMILGGENINGINLTKFTDETTIAMAMQASNRALLLATNTKKVPFAELHAAMNARFVDTAANHLTEAFMLSSPSAFVRTEIASKLLSAEAKAQNFHLRAELENLLTEGLGSAFTRSADSVVNNLGAVGVYLTSAGKRLIDAKNLARESFVKPIANVFQSVAKNDAHVIELNTSLEVLNATKGMRFYRNGQFWKPTEGSKVPFNEVMALSDDEFLAWRQLPNKDGLLPIEVIKYKGDIDFKVVTPSVDAALIEIQKAGREMYELGNVSYKTLAQGNMADIGFWVPATNPTGKQIAYAFNKNTGQTTMILGKTPAELNTRIKEFEDSLGVDKNFYKVITKGKDQDDWNKIHGRHDSMYMSIADSSKLHGGASARAMPSTNTEVLSEIIQGYDYHIGRNIDNIAQLQYAPIMEHMDNLSAIAMKGYSPAALNAVQKGATSPVDPGMVMKNILLGRSNLTQYGGWLNFQTGLQSVADRGLKSISEVLSPVVGKQHRTVEDWKQVIAQMEKEGIVNPFQTVEDFIDAAGNQGIRYQPNFKAGAAAYIREGNLRGEAQSARLVALSNSLAATVVLRMGELAQPLVNIMSLPILTSAAITKKMAGSFMGNTLNKNAKFYVTEAMYDGARFAKNKALSGKLEDLAIKEGLFNDDWRTVNGIMKQVKNLEPGMMSKAEDLVDSTLVNWLSTAADKSEHFVRRQAFFTGAALAKKAYPGISDAGVMTFARNFMNEAIGNYAAAQRPAMFQGTVGVAMGLFQTYMLTMGQHIYTQVGSRNWKGLSKMMLTQQTIFGTASLPGFHPISEMIGEHFSDDNVDLQTGAIRAIGDETATLLLYGLPSQLVGINTRGDIQPRIPNPLSYDTIAAVNFTKQAYTAMERVVSAAFTADANTGRAMLEALSLQSLSRPIARISELASGRSITSSGDVVAKDDELYTVNGIFSRLLATRPIEEIKVREAMHLNTMYGSLDKDRREGVTFRLKSYIENGAMTDEDYSSLANEYLRTGTPTGWRSAVRKATMMAIQPGSYTVRDKFKPESPLNMMIEDLD